MKKSKTLTGAALDLAVLKVINRRKKTYIHSEDIARRLKLPRPKTYGWKLVVFSVKRLRIDGNPIAGIDLGYKMAQSKPELAPTIRQLKVKRRGLTATINKLEDCF